MVPQGFSMFFATSASAGAALVGLLFIAVSIAPHETVKTGAPVERQAISASAFNALINAFFISLSALIPGINLGDVTLLFSIMGLLSAFSLGLHLLRQWAGWRGLLRRGLLAAAGFIIYGYELYFAILLLLSPHDSGPIDGIAGLLLAVYGLGIVRAWQLLGARRYGVSSWLRAFVDPEEGSQS